MIHIVDGQNDTILDDITLENIISDTHKKSLEDTIETYEFITFADREYSQYLTKMNRIIIPDEDGTLRELVIQVSEKYRDTEGLKQQVLSYASYLLLAKEKVIYPTRRTSQTASMIVGWALNNTEWTPGIIESTGVRTFTINNHTNPYAFLKTIANEFDLELRFRVEHNGHQITARYVDLLERIGDFKGREVVFGRDLEDIRRIENNENIVTALVGLGPEKEDGSRLEVLVEDEDALQRWGRPEKNGNLKHLIEVYEPESDRENMTESELRQYTRTELNKRINSTITYECSLIDLEKVYGDNERLYFGDTIRIKDEKFNPPLYLEARIFEIDRSIKDAEQKLVKLGDYKEFSESEVKSVWEQLKQLVQDRLEKLVQVNIVSTAGIIFKNGEGSTELTAKPFLNGSEVDVDGTKYEYRWHKYDKNGTYQPGYKQYGKSIIVNANSIDEKVTYRTEIILNDEVLTIAEITISNVYDGQDGEQGPPGPQGPTGPQGQKGEDGQGVENITLQYYVSTSNTTQTGGLWTDTKPNFQEGKYLWIRYKITYKNPTSEEYTQAVLDDGWQAVKVANEAKEDAQTAMSTADGKNTVFRQATMPPTVNRKIGDLWFNTGQGNKMHHWDGSAWQETKLDYQALSVDKLSAISADLGNVTAGNITGVTLNLANGKVVVDSSGNAVFKGIIEGASGRFGEVTVNEGDITIKDVNSNTKALLTPLPNLVGDPDFESVLYDEYADTGENYNHNWLPFIDPPMKNLDIAMGYYHRPYWVKVGSPMVSLQNYGGISNDFRSKPIFRKKAIVVTNSNYVYQILSSGFVANTTYTISAYFKRQWNKDAGIPRIQVSHYRADTALSNIANQTFAIVPSDYTVVRYSLTFTVPSTFDSSKSDNIRIIIRSGDENWVQADGVQLVRNTLPTIYNPDTYKDESQLIGDLRSIWMGGAYPLGNVTISPKVPLSLCKNGWLLKWQAYAPGVGVETHHYQYSIIPKNQIYNSPGMKFTLSRTNNLVLKYLYVTDTQITGHDDNGTSPNNLLVLTEVLAI